MLIHFHRGNFRRSSESGFSLVTVLLIGMCATLWLAAMTTGLVPLYQRAASTKTMSQLRSAAESAIDYTIDQITYGLEFVNPSPLDDPNPGAPYTSFVAPAALSNGQNVTVNVTVKNTQPPAASAIYDPLIAGGPLANYYRVIEATATNGIFSRSFRVVLQPQQWNPLGTAQQNWAGTGSGPGSTFNPMGQYSLFAANNMTLGTGVQTDGYTSGNPSGYAGSRLSGSNGTQTGPLGGDIGAYGNVTLSPGANPVTVGGSVDVPEGNGSSVLSAQGAGAQSTVDRYITDNGASSGFNDAQGSGSGAVNVDGMFTTAGANFPNDPSRSGSLETGENNIQTPVASSPPTTPFFSDSSTTTAVQNLGDVNLNGVTVTITNSASPPPAGGYVMPSSGTFQMQPGNYEMSSLNMSGASSIVVAPDVNAGQPVRFFINDSNPDGAAANVNGLGISNQSSSPSNFQMYYEGDRSINLAQQSSFSGLVYAPNANLNIGSSLPAQINYFGSFVGNNVSALNASIHYDLSLNPSQGGGNGYLTNLNNAYNQVPSASRPTNSAGFWYFTNSSWQEWPAGMPLPAN
ncbi:MAG TPA: hypothetical protein V6C69_13440 [Trichormus sp.]